MEDFCERLRDHQRAGRDLALVCHSYLTRFSYCCKESHGIRTVENIQRIFGITDPVELEVHNCLLGELYCITEDCLRLCNL